MADRHLFRLTMDGFRPCNDEAQEFVSRCKLGDVVELKPTRVRNGKFHRLYFAILKLISENSAPEITPDEALYFAKLATGTGKWITDTKGNEHFVPGSISFASMKQDDFEAFVKASIPPLCKRFMNDTAPDAVVAEAMAVAA
jgi:hypothetical protein